MGQFIPTTKDSTIKAMPTTASFQPEKLNFFWIRPKMTANTMNMMETMPAEPLVKAASTCAPSASKALKVPATMSAKAAMTMPQNSQQNSRNSLRPVLPMYFSISRPMDLPSFLTEAYSAPKSVTAPKKTPPIRTHSRTGSQPNAAAWMAPVTGPAPAMEENWWANTVQPLVGT